MYLEKHELHNQNLSWSQIWESFVEKRQSQLPLGLRDKNSAEKQRVNDVVTFLREFWTPQGGSREGLIMAVSSMEITDFL